MAEAQLEELISEPVAAFDGSYTRMESLDRGARERLQLEALKLRFGQLRDEIGTLKTLADRQGIDQLDRIEDVFPLLFTHTMYKSYPSKLLLEKRFDLLTDWLGRLTSADLSGVDVSDCNSVDEWFDRLDRQTELCVLHTSGTTGTMSFLPWSKREMDAFVGAMGTIFSQTFGVEEDWRESEAIDVVFPYFRSGGGLTFRQNDSTEKLIARSPDRFHALFPQRVSSDVLYLSARMRAAAMDGQADPIEVDPELLERKEEFERLRADMAGRVTSFLDEIADELGGQRIWTIGSPQMLTEMAQVGLAKGRSRVFAPNSILICAGGRKGWDPPKGWRETILEFFGAAELRFFYGMSEVGLVSRLCERGRYHINPWVIPFVLDPDTGDPLPRAGVTSGRAAFYDLMAGARWGGFISGDEITLHWDGICECGRSTLYMDDGIQRLSESRGGDDKITCAATEESHREALDYLTALEGA